MENFQLEPGEFGRRRKEAARLVCFVSVSNGPPSPEKLKVILRNPKRKGFKTVR